MHHRFVILLIASLLSAGTLAADQPRELLDDYARQARTVDPAFSGFSAQRGQTLHTTRFTGGKPDTPSCTHCHDVDPAKPGQTPTGKVIEPLSPRLTPARFTDPAKVEKWFRRNCNEVLGRACTPLEKGDWLSFVSRP